MTYQHLQFDEALKYAQITIVTMQRDLKEYQKRDDASADHIRKRKELITRLVNFVNASIDCVNDYSKTSASEYKRGFQAGIRRGRKYSLPGFSNQFDKEALRNDSIQRAIIDFNL